MSRSEGQGVDKGRALTGAVVVVAAIVLVSLVAAWTGGINLQGDSGGSGPTNSPTVSRAGGPGGVMGLITAGPTCAAEQASPDPKCAPRPVAGAVVVAKDAIGDEVGRAISLPDGSYRLPVGLAETVTITALPVAGLISAPASVSITFPDQFDWETLNLAYDTGIR
jgi:hypothetical protein